MNFGASYPFSIFRRALRTVDATLNLKGHNPVVFSHRASWYNSLPRYVSLPFLSRSPSRIYLSYLPFFVIIINISFLITRYVDDCCFLNKKILTENNCKLHAVLEFQDNLTPLSFVKTFCHT